MRIRVTEVCGQSRVFRRDGERLRSAIKEVWARGLPCEVDFGNVRIASVSFLDEGIAVLALELPRDELLVRLRVENMTPPDRRLLDELISARAREREEALGESKVGSS